MNDGGIMICDICGQEGARTRHITRSYGKGDNLLLIENVPVINCPHCGASYFTAETLHEIEHIKLHRGNFATKRAISVAGYMLGQKKQSDRTRHRVSPQKLWN